VYDTTRLWRNRKVGMSYSELDKVKDFYNLVTGKKMREND
jgi:hypothetical protein